MELEEILAKRQKRGKQTDDKPLEEKTVLHGKYLLLTFWKYISFILLVWRYCKIVELVWFYMKSD